MRVCGELGVLSFSLVLFCLVSKPCFAERGLCCEALTPPTENNFFLFLFSVEGVRTFRRRDGSCSRSTTAVAVRTGCSACCLACRARSALKLEPAPLIAYEPLLSDNRFGCAPGAPPDRMLLRSRCGVCFVVLSSRSGCRSGRCVFVVPRFLV